MSIVSSRRRQRGVNASAPTCPDLAPPSPAGGDHLALQPSLEEALDAQGLIRDGDLRRGLPLLASWTQDLLRDQASGALNGRSIELFQKFVDGLLRFARRDGSIIFGDIDPRQHSGQLKIWRAAAQWVGPATQRAMNAALRGLKLDVRPSAVRGAVVEPPPSCNCEWAGLAVLRPSWSAARLTVEYRGTQFRCELDRDGETIFAGEYDPRVTLDGVLLTPQSNWEPTCWVSDDDVDYLELQLALAGDMRIQRHVVFAREDEFLFLADAVLGQRPGALRYQTALPCAAGVSVEAFPETRELSLTKKGRRRAVVLPLALSEWRQERRYGEVEHDSGALELTQSAAHAGCLFSPWFIDLAPRRLGRPVTWRRLTVAEDLQIQADDVVVGYRVQVANRQWMFYRSLADRGNRTLLGHNLVSEFLAARFGRDGLPETLIEIEGPADDDD
jgi:hypothetical protein